MSLMRGQPFVYKLATVAKYGVFPAAMIAALLYSPPDYAFSKSQKPQK